MAARLVWD